MRHGLNIYFEVELKYIVFIFAIVVYRVEAVNNQQSIYQSYSFNFTCHE